MRPAVIFFMVLSLSVVTVASADPVVGSLIIGWGSPPASAHVLVHCRFGGINEGCPARTTLPLGYSLFVSSCEDDASLTYCDPFAYGTATIVVASNNGSRDPYWIDYAAGEHGFEWAYTQTVTGGPVTLSAWIDDLSPTPGVPGIAAVGHSGTLNVWLTAPS